MYGPGGANSRPLSRLAVDSLRCSIPGCVRRVNTDCFPEPGAPDTPPHFPGYALQGAENRQMVNQTRLLLQHLLHHFFCQVVGKEECVYSVGWYWFHRYPTLSQLSSGDRDAKSFREDRRASKSVKQWAFADQGVDKPECCGNKVSTDDNIQKSGNTEYPPFQSHFRPSPGQGRDQAWPEAPESGPLPYSCPMLLWDKPVFCPISSSASFHGSISQSCHSVHTSPFTFKVIIRYVPTAILLNSLALFPYGLNFF